MMMSGKLTNIVSVDAISNANIGGAGGGRDIQKNVQLQLLLMQSLPFSPKSLRKYFANKILILIIIMVLRINCI